jgi:hypothetical protein
MILPVLEMMWRMADPANRCTAAPPLDEWKAALRKISTAQLEEAAEDARPLVPHMRKRWFPTVEEMALYDKVQDLIRRPSFGPLSVRSACRIVANQLRLKPDTVRKRYEHTEDRLSRLQKVFKIEIT